MSIPPTTATAPSTHASSPITLLYDGACPLCLREVDFLRRRDANRGLVQFVDIASNDYQPADYKDIDYETAMARIHAIRADGTVVKNVAVFREIYDILGIGWVYTATRWPIIGPLTDFIYGIWAKYRLQLTGRPSLTQLVAERNQRETCRCA